jgi:UDP-N-acetylmuramoyl-tripeptide--D-alanyl-D-alanine ligase
MKPLMIKEILNATKGELLKGELQDSIIGVKIDSRKIIPGDLFVPIKGEIHDGHIFIEDAINKGCTAILISDKTFLENNKYEEYLGSFILVNNPVKAIQNISAYYLSQFNIKKIAVTGSTGKTTTKDMLYAILCKDFSAVKNFGNYNNELGLPLSIFNIEDKHQVGIFEMGMSSLGEIDLMADILRPDIALITNIGLSHIEHLGTKDNILKAKMEVANYFNSSGILIINGDDELLREISNDESRNHNENAFKIISVGLTSGCDVKISDVDSSKENMVSFELNIKDEIKYFELAASGAHNANNAAMALTCAALLGMYLNGLEEVLRNYEATDKRLNIFNAQGIKIIDDTYNASPDSMKAALDVLASYKSKRKVAILGDMFELGINSQDFHQEILDYTEKLGIDLTLCIGEYFTKCCQDKSHIEENQKKLIWFNDKEELKVFLTNEILEDDVVLVKGSRGMTMEKIVTFLGGKITE